MLSTTNIHWLARPHVLSWIFLLTMLLFVTQSRLSACPSSPRLANMHGSFFLGPLILATYASPTWSAH